MEFLSSIPLDQLLIQTINGIVTGMILALVASGLTLIFGIMDVVNFAHGELFMLGAYVGVITLTATGSFWLALVGATLLIGLLGAVIHVTTLRPLLGRDPLTTILATFGISLVLLNYALWQFGPVSRKIQEPFTGYFTLFYLDYPWYRLVIAGLSASMITALYLFLKFGTYGIWILAAIFISLLEAYASLWVSPAQAVIVSFVALILTLLFRPTGLFVSTPRCETASRFFTGRGSRSYSSC